MLVGITLETSQKQYTVDFKLETYLKIAVRVLEIVTSKQYKTYKIPIFR